MSGLAVFGKYALGVKVDLRSYGVEWGTHTACR